jgi:hypothetical protein
VVIEAVHGTSARWHAGCHCPVPAGTQRHQASLENKPQHGSGSPSRSWQQLLDGVYGRRPFRTVIRDLELTPNQLWGLTKTDQEWSEKLEAALTATRQDNLEHGTNAAYVAASVCSECRENQRVRMGRNSGEVQRPALHIVGVLDLRRGESAVCGSGSPQLAARAARMA